MPKFNPFKFKVIETVYNGYRFRSRLEARWAVFFDTLEIKYEYEKEGYDLEGTWYLPDFFLPDLDIFVEIKGQEPTSDELYKARQLALYTDKKVYVIYGNVGAITELESPYEIYMEYPSDLCFEWEEDGLMVYEEIPLSLEIRVILQRLDEISMGLRVQGRQLQLYPTNKCRGMDDLPDYLDRLKEQHTRLSQIAALLQQNEEELRSVLTINKQGATLTFHGQEDFDGYEWMECENCHEVNIFPCEPAFHHQCTPTTSGVQNNASERLSAAYAAARQARF